MTDMRNKSAQNLRLHFRYYALEAEMKFLTDQETLEDLLDFVGRQGPPFIPKPVERDERTNVYYDTKKKFHLFRRQAECRARAKSSQGEYTTYRYDLKTPKNIDPKVPRSRGQMLDESGVFLRREYNHIGTNETPILQDFSRGGVRRYLSGLFSKVLIPWVKGTFQRSKFTFSPTGHPDSQVEIAFERGYYATMDDKIKSDEMYIVELELKSGTLAALIDCARHLQDRYPGKLNLCLKTKGEMGLEWVSAHLPKQDRKNLKKAREDRDHLLSLK